MPAMVAMKNGQPEPHDIAAPHASSMFESLRAFGYELPTALADLIDNSVFAGSRNVWIDFEWDGENSNICVTDDGCGMTEEELVNAMRPGSRSPREKRDAKDLGRFGLGLKTASLSQGRRVTVRTKQAPSEDYTRCWDLDYVAETRDWSLLRRGDDSAEARFHRLTAMNCGTAVCWQKLDQIVEGQITDDDAQHRHFLSRIDAVGRHLGMVFHRLMEGRRPLHIFLNGREVEAWDPFLGNEPATLRLARTALPFMGESIIIEPFVLPHLSKLTPRLYARAAGVRGWNAHQGFYVYRNERLLVPGDWLGFGWSKDDAYKLARILVDLPNTLDLQWNIDVTKSKASPPTPLRAELRRIAERTRSDAKRIYTHRGAKLLPRTQGECVFLWEPRVRHSKTFYHISREHPLVRQVTIGCTNRPALNALLRLLEETIPLQHITFQNNETPDMQPGPFERVAEREVRDVMYEAYKALLACGYSHEEAQTRLGGVWPFELFPALLQTLKEEENNSE
jgi:hypothetical protein